MYSHLLPASVVKTTREELGHIADHAERTAIRVAIRTAPSVYIAEILCVILSQ